MQGVTEHPLQKEIILQHFKTNLLWNGTGSHKLELTHCLKGFPGVHVHIVESSHLLNEGALTLNHMCHRSPRLTHAFFSLHYRVASLQMVARYFQEIQLISRLQWLVLLENMVVLEGELYGNDTLLRSVSTNYALSRLHSPKSPRISYPELATLPDSRESRAEVAVAVHSTLNCLKEPLSAALQSLR